MRISKFVFLKLLLFLLLPLLLSSHVAAKAYAAPSVEIIPSRVTDNTKTIDIKFKGLTPGDEYKADLWLNNYYGEDSIGNANAQGEIILQKICGADVKTLITRDSQHHLQRSCNDNDFFNANIKYEFALNNMDGKQLLKHSFTVSPFYPDVNLTAANGGNKLTKDDGLKFVIKGSKHPINNTKRNTYRIVISKIDGKTFKGGDGNSGNKKQDAACRTVQASTGEAEWERGPVGEEGAYVAKIYAANDKDKSIEWDTGGTACDDGGFQFFSIPFTVGPDGKIGEKQKDPANKDKTAEDKQINITSPCKAVGEGKNRTYQCDTVLGTLDASPQGAIGLLLKYGLIFGGLIAFIMILYGGFMITTSNGVPDRVNNAKAYITSAILGLIFILASVFLLGFIGNGILGIDLNPELVKKPEQKTTTGAPAGKPGAPVNPAGAPGNQEGVPTNPDGVPSGRTDVQSTTSSDIRSLCEAFFANASEQAISNCFSSLWQNRLSTVCMAGNAACTRKIMAARSAYNNQDACQVAGNGNEASVNVCISRLVTAVERTN